MTDNLIVASHVLCPVGRGCEQAWASVRAGLGRIGSSSVMDSNCEPIQMALVPDEALAPLTAELDSLPLPPRARRMLRLAAPVLRNAAESAAPRPIRLYLSLPHLNASDASWLKGFAIHLVKMAELTLDAPNSRVFASGRAGALTALELALQTLDREPDARIVVGGVDTHLDLRLLASLEAERRILGPRVMDGFVPGEGAAFFMLSRTADARSRPVALRGAATISDPGHRTGSEPARSEGLARAVEALRARLNEPVAPVVTVFAGLNGESFDARQWGVARLRHGDFFAPGITLEHPADSFGDAGAATGAILTALAATALARGERRGPALVWAASDHEPRACAMLEVA